MRLTTDHPASSHNQPVLVDDAGTAYGPADPLPDGSTAADHLLTHLDAFPPADADRFLRQWGTRWADWTSILADRYLASCRGFSCRRCRQPIDGPAVLSLNPPAHLHVSCHLVTSGLRNIS